MQQMLYINDNIIKRRDLSIDTLKGFLIILVVLGHIIGSLHISGGVKCGI